MSHDHPEGEREDDAPTRVTDIQALYAAHLRHHAQNANAQPVERGALPTAPAPDPETSTAPSHAPARRTRSVQTGLGVALLSAAWLAYALFAAATSKGAQPAHAQQGERTKSGSASAPALAPPAATIRPEPAEPHQAAQALALGEYTRALELYHSLCVLEASAAYCQVERALRSGRVVR